MEEDELILRKECLSLAVDSGAHFSEALGIATHFYNYILEGTLPAAEVVPFIRAVPRTPNT